MVLSPSLKRVVPARFPPGARLVSRGPAAVSGCRALIFVPLPWFSTSGQKHGSDALARLKRPCCGAAPFFFRRQAGVAGKPWELLLMRFACAVSSRTFSVKPLLGQEAASSCSPLALERGLSAALSVAASCCSCLT